MPVEKIISKIPKDKTAKTDTVNLEQYSGTYTSQPWDSEKIITSWYGDLVMLNLPDENPDEDMTVLQHVSGDLFKRVRRDKTPGEEIRFERDTSGKVIRVLQHSNYSTRRNSDKK